jgi:hypothetical protein
MNPEIPTQFDGTFWLPADRETTVGGTLDLSDDWPKLLLVEPLIDDFDNSMMLHGEVDDDGHVIPVTLLGASSREIGLHPLRETADAEHLIWGSHELGGADQVFRDIRLQFKHLDQWAQLQDDGRVSARFQSFVQRIELFRALQISRAPNYRGTDPLTTIELSTQSPHTLDALWRLVVQPLRALFTTIVNEKCPVTDWQVKSEFTNNWVEIRNPYVQPLGGSVRMRRVLWTRATLTLNHMERWITEATRLYPIPAVVEKVTGTRQWDFDTELLSLAACTEGLHRMLRPGPRDETNAESARTAARAEVAGRFNDELAERVYQRLKDFNDWMFRERLEDLIEPTRVIDPGLTGNTAEWIERVKAIRNGFAHMLTDEPDAVLLNIRARSHEYIVLHESTRWLLVMRLMQNIEMRNDDIREAILNFGPYQNFQYRIRLWLPEVYQAADETVIPPA